MSPQRPRRALALELLEDRLTPVSFGPGMSYTAGSNGSNVVTGDLNGDGYADVLFIDAVSGLLTYISDSSGNLTLTNGAPISDPRSVVLVDMNGDHKLDLVVANGALQQASVWLGNGDGTFQSPIAFAVGGPALGVAVADYNGDGHMDAAVVHGVSVSILFGNGTPSLFAPAVEVANDGDNESIATGDFNGDGKPDLVTGVYVGDKVNVLLNKGNGTFAAQASYSLRWHGAGVVTGDFDGNGRDDVVVSYGNIGDVAVLLANPDGTLQPLTEYGIPGSPSGLAVADYDLDGRLDLALSDFDSSRGFVFTGNGDGTFGAPIQVSTGTNPSAIATGDFNGDGRPDLVSSDTTSPAAIMVTLNTTTLTVGSFLVNVPPGATAGVPVAVTVTARTGVGTTLTDYTGTVHFTSTDGLAILPSDVTFSPIDNGVKTVMVTLRTVGNQTITATDTLNSASGESASMRVTAPPALSTTTLTPLNGPTVFGDAASFIAAVTLLAGRPVPTGTFTLINESTNQVIATAGLDTTGRAIFNLTTLPPGSTSLRVDYSGDSSYLASSSATVVQVVDRQNRIVVGSDAGPIAVVQVYDPRTRALVREIRPFDLYTGGVKVATGDVNGDGVADIIVSAGAGAPGGHVKVYDGVSFAELASFFTFLGYDGGVNVSSGDVDGDGYADLIIGTAIANDHVKVFSGHGLISGEGPDGSTLMSFFAYGDDNPVGVTVGAGDVDGDGRADVITGSATFAGHVKVFQALTGQLLGSYFAYGAGYLGGIYVAGGDINGDGRSEIITGATSAPHVKALTLAGQELASFYAYLNPDGSPASLGVRVGSVDRNGDRIADILTGAGGSAPAIKVFSGLDPSQLLDSFIAVSPGQPATSGAFVAGSNG